MKTLSLILASLMISGTALAGTGGPDCPNYNRTDRNTNSQRNVASIASQFLGNKGTTIRGTNKGNQ